MFDFIVDSFENGLNILDGLVMGELPSKRQLSKLLADGVSIAAIAEATGFAAEVIEQLIDEE